MKWPWPPAAQERHGEYTVVRRRIYILPTRLGIGFLLLIALIESGAINYDLSAAHGLAFWLLAIWLAAAVENHRNLLGLTLQAQPIEPVFAGESSLLGWRALMQRERFALRLKRGPQTCDFAVLAETAPVQLIVPTTQRGRFPLGKLTLESRHPLGLFRAWSPFTSARCYRVWPQPHPNPPALPARDSGGTAQSQQRRAGEDEFAGLREYVAGDSLRQIAWRQSARSDRLLSRVHDEAQTERLTLDWYSLSAHDTETRLAILAAWIVQAEALHLLWRLQLPALSTPYGTGPAHASLALDALADHELAA